MTFSESIHYGGKIRRTALNLIFNSKRVGQNIALLAKCLIDTDLVQEEYKGLSARELAERMEKDAAEIIHNMIQKQLAEIEGT